MSDDSLGTSETTSSVVGSENKETTIEKYSDQYIGWSLKDVLKYSPQASSKEGVVDVHTALAGVVGSMVRVDCGDNFTIQFSTIEGNKLEGTIRTGLSRNEIDFKTEESPEAVLIDAGVYGKYHISKSEGSNPSEIKITFPDKRDQGADIADALNAARLVDLLKLNKLPRSAEEALDRKYLEFWDGRTIPVVKASGKDDALSLVYPPDEGKVRLIHGTSFDKAMNVSQEGLFGENKPNFQNPTLNEGFEYAHEAARARAGLNGWQTYLILDVEQNEYENQGGFVEPVGIPAKPYEGSRERLRDVIPNMWDSPNLTWVPPERIKQVILIKEKI